uniref:Uncharacterized protein n=1 Tax=Grammatophora oceanica TaxID=210454 RepID=A0A7S1V6J1_9STRA
MGAVPSLSHRSLAILTLHCSSSILRQNVSGSRKGYPKILERSLYPVCRSWVASTDRDAGDDRLHCFHSTDGKMCSMSAMVSSFAAARHPDSVLRPSVPSPTQSGTTTYGRRGTM